MPRQKKKKKKKKKHGQDSFVLNTLSRAKYEYLQSQNGSSGRFWPKKGWTKTPFYWLKKTARKNRINIKSINR